MYMGPPGIIFVEWLSTGIMVHFADKSSAFFPLRFLLDQRDKQPLLVDPVETDLDLRSL